MHNLIKKIDVVFCIEVEDNVNFEIDKPWFYPGFGNFQINIPDYIQRAVTESYSKHDIYKNSF